MIGVHTGPGRYRVAVAELPLSARLAERGEAEIVVAAALDDLPPSCSTLVLADPAVGCCAAPCGDAAVIVDRPWLRADVAEDAGAHPDAALFSVECSSSAADLPALVRDALGWLRVLSGQDLVLDAAQSVPHGVMAQLRAGRTTATLIASVRVEGAPSRLRAMALGVERIEVTADAAGACVEVSTEAGVTRLPRRWESRERMTLRRAIRAGVCERDDLRSWELDAALAAVVLART